MIADEFQHYINQGGMELVTFTPSRIVDRSRRQSRKIHLPQLPPARQGPEPALRHVRLSLGLAGRTSTPLVYARNLAGTEATAHFWFKLFPKKFRMRDLELTDALMDKLVNPIDPTGQVLPGKDLLSRFLNINGEMRRQNNQQLADLRFKTEEKVLWNGPFIHWGKEESVFADVRNYIYKGKKVDQQVHLGFDLSDVQNSPVKAANDGRVVWADDLGIYGNCIVLDHGYGLQSIYGHLTAIDVKEGEMVEEGTEHGDLRRRPDSPAACTCTSACRSTACRSTRANGGTSTGSTTAS